METEEEEEEEEQSNTSRETNGLKTQLSCNHRRSGGDRSAVHNRIEGDQRTSTLTHQTINININININTNTNININSNISININSNSNSNNNINTDSNIKSNDKITV